MMSQLLFQGISVQRHDADLNAIVEDLQLRREYAHNQKIDHVIEFLNLVVQHWGVSRISKKYPYLKNISDFLKKENLENNMRISLHGNYHALDMFVDLGDPKLLFHAQPRGLTVHWLAGNVSVLGLFSIVSALITKNVCLVKASKRGYEDLVELLETFREVNTEHINGADFMQSVAVVLVDREDARTHEFLSKCADARIAWGGLEAIETVMRLEKSPFCEDIIFGPKYSYALIDKESLSQDMKKLASRLAVDVSVFDQYACSSPHTVFVQENHVGEALEFAEQLAQQLDIVQRTLLPKGGIDQAKALEILQVRTMHEMTGRVFSSKGTEWTVVYTDEEGLARGCFSRVIFVKPINELSQIAKYNNRQKQTLGLGLGYNNKKKEIDTITLKGIDRCPDIGYMTVYEFPWDGMFVLDRLVRWVTIYKEL